MYYCNEFFSLSVLSLYEGELLGKVDKLYFDKKLKKLIEIEILSVDGIRHILPTKHIYHIGKNAITVKNNQALTVKIENSQNTNCPIGSKAYSISGEFLGVIQEISLNDKYLTEKISLDTNKILEVNQVASCGKTTVIFCEQNKKVDIKKFTPIVAPAELKNDVIQTASILPSEPEKKEENVIKPSIKETNASFLIGRICTKDIFNFNNEILIKSHGIVNKKNLKEITKYGKLRELMLYTK